MCTRSFPGVKDGRGVQLTTHPLLVPWSLKGRAIYLRNLWATTGSVTGTLYFALLYLLGEYTHIHTHTHTYITFQQSHFLKAGRRAKHYESAECISPKFISSQFLHFSNLHCFLPFQYTSSSKPFYCIRHMMVLIYLIYVIMKGYTLSCREIFYTVNRHGIQFAVLYRPNC